MKDLEEYDERESKVKLESQGTVGIGGHALSSSSKKWRRRVFEKLLTKK
jgi:hypothetical protein